MPFLLIGAGSSAAIDKRLKADSSAVDALKKKVEQYQESIARIPTFNDLMVLLGVIFLIIWRVVCLFRSLCSFFLADSFARFAARFAA